MKKTELEFTKHGIVMPTNRTDTYKNEDYTDRIWEEYHQIKNDLIVETSKRKQLEEYVEDTLKPRIYELETQLERYKKAVSELQKVTDAVKLWSESSAYTHAGRLMGALHEYEANNGISG